MRLAAFVRTGRAAGAAARRAGRRSASSTAAARRAAGEAYGVSAVVLFPVLAWQTKLLLDVEPDVQRRLARVSRRAAAARRPPACSPPVVGLAGVRSRCSRRGCSAASPARISRPERSSPGVALGRAGRTCSRRPPAVALGALASRAVTRSAALRRRGARRSARSAGDGARPERLDRAVAGPAGDGHRPGADRPRPAADLGAAARADAGRRWRWGAGRPRRRTRWLRRTPDADLRARDLPVRAPRTLGREVPPKDRWSPCVSARSKVPHTRAARAGWTVSDRRPAMPPARPVRPAPGRFSLSRALETTSGRAMREEGHGGQAGSGRQGHRRRRAHRAASGSSTATVLTEYRGLTVAQLNAAAALAGRPDHVRGREEHAGQACRGGRGHRRSRRAVHRSYRARLRLRRRRRGGEGSSRLREGPPAPGHQGRRLRGQGRSRRPRSASSPTSSPARCCWPSWPAR